MTGHLVYRARERIRQGKGHDPSQNISAENAYKAFGGHVGEVVLEIMRIGRLNCEKDGSSTERVDLLIAVMEETSVLVAERTMQLCLGCTVTNVAQRTVSC